MSAPGTKQSRVTPDPEILDPSVVDVEELETSRRQQAEGLRQLWENRRILLRAAAIGLLASTVIAVLIPNSYTTTAQLMPSDTQATSTLGMMAAMASSKTGSALGGVAGDLLGLKSSGALFIGVLKSQTSQDRIVEQFDLRKIYGKRRVTDARAKLDQNTSIVEDRKSGIISISVTDRSPQRAADIANAYVNQLNSLVAELSTSSAHRERVFLEERLKVVKQDLDDAANQLAQFSSKNTTLDVEQEGKAMLDAAGTLTSALIAAQSQLEGLRQIYTDNNARVRSLSARVEELRKELQKLGGISGDSTTGSHSSSKEFAGLSSDKPGDMPFPTIRSLPLLGARYADYYRRAKIEETVFELLTEQYELAKVEEAKETPTVKILDPALVPEKKSFPPRLLIVLMGACVAFAGCAFWTLGTKKWHEVQADDPRKILAEEVLATLKGKARLPWGSQNGEGHNSENGDGLGTKSLESTGQQEAIEKQAR